MLTGEECEGGMSLVRLVSENMLKAGHRTRPVLVGVLSQVLARIRQVCIGK